MEQARLERLRLLLLGDKTQDGQDDLIALLITYAESRLGLILASIRKQYGVSNSTIPDELSWVLDEVVSVRFNRIGSEGMTSQTVGSQSVAYSGEEFSDYLDDIISYVINFEDGKQPAREGRVIFH